MKKEKSAPVNEAKTQKMISAEAANGQIQAIIKQANTKINELAMRLESMEEFLRDKTLEHLFHVVEYATYFEPTFVDKCIEAISECITRIALEVPDGNKKENVETKEE